MKKYLLSLWLLLGIVSLAVAQQRQITGVVRSADKAEALPGVTVVEVGTSNGATTDGEGRFVLTVAGPAAKLRLSYIGFVSQDVTVGTRSSITVELREDSQALNDVVVIGYQAVQRRDVTGAGQARPAFTMKPTRYAGSPWV